MRRGRHVLIRPVAPSDYSWLFDTTVFTTAGSHWRLHGDTPTYEQFLDVLLKGARATYVIVHSELQELVGMVQLWNYNPPGHHAQITAFLHPDFRGKGWPMEGLILFADYAFATWDLNKIYFETLESELVQFRSLIGTLLVEEGLLKQHRRVFGQWLDCSMLAVYRGPLTELARRTLPADVSLLVQLERIEAAAHGA